MSDIWLQALNYYNSAVEHNPQDESALLNRAITKVGQPQN